MTDSLKKISKRAREYQHVLMIMRHAKAESAGMGADSDRELTDKGLKQAKRVAKGLVSMKLMPDAIVCSGAVRARQTVARMVKVFGDGPSVDYRQSLYESGRSAMWEELSTTNDATERLLIVGHEPSVSMTVGSMAARDSDSAALALLSVGVSSATVAILASDKPFSEWTEHDARLIALLSPKEFN